MTAEVVTEIEATEMTRLGTRHIELLESNTGRKCAVVLHDGSRLEGKILEVLVEEGQDERSGSTPAAPHLLASALPVITRSLSSGSLFVLRTDEGDVALAISDIRRLIIREMSLDTTAKVTHTTTSKRLTFRFAESGARRDLVLFYFTPGLRWIPTYRIELEADAGERGTARLALQAEILNEVEDLDDAEVSLVVGVPNFRFRKVVSPLSLEATLRDALAQAAPQLSGQVDQMSNVLFTQRTSEWRAADDAPATPASTVPALPDELSAGGAHDLFVYHLGRLTLGKGARAAVPISSTTVPYRDLYTWDLGLKRNDIETAPSGSGVASPLVLAEARVWHLIELTNSTDQPWTTGAAMLMQGLQPLAQELLTYTSPGGKVRVPVTVAVDLRGSFSEEETGRTLEALRWRSSTYAKIDKIGRMALANDSGRPVQVEITCQLGGRATEASGDGRITLDAFRQEDWTSYSGDPAVNNHSTVTWRSWVKPGAVLRPTVSYHYFARQ
jgi:hypothetical protein